MTQVLEHGVGEHMDTVAGVADVVAESSLEQRFIFGLDGLLILFLLGVENVAYVNEVQYQSIFIFPFNFLTQDIVIGTFCFVSVDSAHVHDPCIRI